MNIARATPPARHPGRPTAPPPATDEPAQDSPHGCGWFDSSHELRTGLCITEHDSPDRVANELALDVWLCWHLAGQDAPAAAARGWASSGV